MRRAVPIVLSEEEEIWLRTKAGDRKTPPRIRLRARILLGATSGRSNREIARSLRLDPATVSFWRRRFATHRLLGHLEDAPRPGRRAVRTAELSDRVLHATYHEPPRRGSRWTTRTLGDHLGVNHMLVHRIWKASGVVPVAAAPNVERIGPRVDLYGVLLHPPRRAVVFGIERGREALPAGGSPAPPVPHPGISGGFLFRPGSSDGAELLTLLERMEAFVGLSGGPVSERHDLLSLLREIDERSAPTTQIHVFAESPGEGDGERLAAWLDHRPRYVLHGFPTGSEWRDGLREFVQEWSSGSDLDLPLLGVPLFATAAARFAAGSGSGAAGLFWSFSPPNPSSDRDRRSVAGRGAGSPRRAVSRNTAVSADAHRSEPGAPPS